MSSLSCLQKPCFSKLAPNGFLSALNSRRGSNSSLIIH